MDSQYRGLAANRSVPACTVIPVLTYKDVGEAVDWLRGAFGFTERLRIGDHRAQLNVGEGAVIVREPPTGSGAEPIDAASHAVLVRVADVDRHYERARAYGAHILHPPADHPYGERQYNVEDPGGHCWTFSQSIADVEPSQWGGLLIETDSR